jgi:hypothetical protein
MVFIVSYNGYPDNELILRTICCYNLQVKILDCKTVSEKMKKRNESYKRH